MYKLYHTLPSKGEADAVLKINKDGSLTSFLFDPANTDAQQFAKWLQDGNVPEAAEEGGTVSPEWIAETITKLLPNG